jgi:hypothetical protein
MTARIAEAGSAQSPWPVHCPVQQLDAPRRQLGPGCVDIINGDRELQPGAGCSWCAWRGHDERVRLYAHEYPQEVAGIVLVDPMHEDQFERIGPLIPPSFPGEPDALTHFRRFWTEEWRDPMKNFEGIDFQANRDQAAAIGSLGDIPMLVLAASDFVRMAPPGAPEAARMQQLWQELRHGFVQQSSNARQILVETSGRFMQREQPEVVVAAIRQMIEIVNGPSA